MRAEGLFLNFTTSEITTIQTKAKTLLTEGKTLMVYGIGGRINADIFAVKRDKVFVILGLLERTEMIRRRATKKHTVITLVNWSKYQIEETLSGHKPDTERTREKKGKEREEEIALPEELDVPVIALAQLNRAIEQDATRVPRLSDLRESGSIEADSDAVLFIHCQNPAVNQDGRLLCQIVVSKNRSGRQGMFDICFVREFSRFDDWRDHQDLVDMAEKMEEAKTKPKGGRSAWRSAKR